MYLVVTADNPPASCQTSALIDRHYNLDDHWAVFRLYGMELGSGALEIREVNDREGLFARSVFDMQRVGRVERAPVSRSARERNRDRDQGDSESIHDR